LFVLSRLSTRRITKSSARVNPQGRSTEKVKLLLNDNHLEPQAVRPQRNRGDDRLRLAETQMRRAKTPFLACQISKWFYDTSTGTATRAARCGSLLERLRLSTLKQDGHSGHEDLRGSGRRSVIPYVHGDVVLLCVLFNSKVELA
jgi:hypothetical protein